MAELRTYRRKRDFTKTSEPEGAAGKKPKAHGMFCVQKHAARQLHHDLRLELDGVLVSWAVPKGPSLDPRQRRLAVHVEDHPVEYGDFEGTIPKGEYGGGTVMLWDTGTWEPDGDPHAGLEKGELKFRLEGERLRGGWVLVHTRGRGGEDNQWLLIKERDEEARTGEPDPWGADDRSVSTGRTMDEIAKGARPRKTAARSKAAAAGGDARSGSSDGGDARRGGSAGDDARRSRSAGRSGARERRDVPATVSLSLATLVESPPDGADWVHEIKYDGYRIAARVDDGHARLFSRNGLDWTDRFTEVADALTALPTSGTWLDGEVVVFDERGVSDFGRLQRHLKEGRPGDLAYVVFDLLYQDGEDLRGLPLRERKRRLQWLLGRGSEEMGDVVRYGDHIEGRGSAVFEEACQQGLEGVVSKRAGDAYPGRRSRSWLKSKCARRQEFVVGGFSEPAGSRTGFGALLLGVYDEEGALRYAGRVGTGFDERTLTALSAKLRKLEQDGAPFADPPRGAQARGVHWVAPELVAEVRFSEWTDDGQLRQPVFQGLREDKSAAEVRREDEARAARADAPTAPPEPAGRAKGRAKPAAKRRGGGPKHPARPAAGAPAESSQAPADPPAAPAESSEAPARTPQRPAKPVVAGVAISHPDRVVFPDPGLTKLDVAEYYAAVAEVMLPYLEHRALTVVRCPDGIGSECFFQKNVTPSVPRAVSKVRVRGADGKATVYPVVDTPEALLAMVQNGAVEFHVWGSRVGAIETPDLLVFDLDPAPGLEWRKVREAARALRSELADRGLESFVRTSGGKGLHVVVPFTPRARWPRVGAFAREVVESLVRREPHKYTATMSKAKRGGKVFVDHFRNGRGATSVTSYSLRARAGAPVALPVGWDELGRIGAGNEWTAERVLRRLRTRKHDPWRDFFAVGGRQSLPEGDG